MTIREVVESVVSLKNCPRPITELRFTLLQPQPAVALRTTFVNNAAKKAQHSKDSSVIIKIIRNLYLIEENTKNTTDSWTCLPLASCNDRRDAVI